MTRIWMRGAAIAAMALAAGACSRPAGQPGSGSAASAASAASVAAAAITTTVPFVGCPSDGQIGAQPAPTGGAKSVTMDPDAAAKLAYYVMENGPGVLAPRGWSCAGIYGSDGATLIVSPQPVKPGDLMGQSWAGAAGDAIQVTVASGDTSGRFQVAQAIMRLFPAHQAFAQNVVQEGVEPASNFPAGPYPSDRMTTRSGELVEFATPANTVGFGTDVNTNTRLKPGADPAQGAVALVGGTPDLLFAVVRLSPDLQALSGPIISQFEADNPAGGSQAQTASSASQ